MIDDIIRKFLDLHPDTPIDDKQYAVPLWVIRRMLETAEAAEREKYYELLEEIKVWREAYPLSIFPVPDWEKVLDALTMNGLTLDAISAANLRHAANRFYEMLDETIRARGQK